MKECKHRFQPRYNREWSTMMKDIVSSKNELKANASHCNPSEPYLFRETYIYDICVKCGETRCQL